MWRIFVDDFGHTLKSEFFLFFSLHSHVHSSLSSPTILSLLCNVRGSAERGDAADENSRFRLWTGSAVVCISAPCRKERAGVAASCIFLWMRAPGISLSLFISILIPKQGLSICLLQWKHRVLSTGLAGKSQTFFLWCYFEDLSVYLFDNKIPASLKYGYDQTGAWKLPLTYNSV